MGSLSAAVYPDVTLGRTGFTVKIVSIFCIFNGRSALLVMAESGPEVRLRDVKPK